ncbi:MULTISPECIES: hypothetical protein [Streptomyces]|uniref:hypothetical protein n=1 Tax=Streptomyces TaxID=1883 RepID=UPI002FF13BBE
MNDFWIALIGALVGGGFTLLGTWLQSRTGNKAAHLAQTRATAQRGVEAATTLAITIQRQSFRGHGTFEDREGWGRELMAHESNLTALLGLIPDDQRETRDRVFDLLAGVQHWDGQEVWEEYRIRTTLYLGEMAVWLVSLARGSKPPEREDMARVASERVTRYRRAALEAELELLSAEGDALELDDEGRARAHEIRTELGRMDGRGQIPGPSGSAGHIPSTPS